MHCEETVALTSLAIAKLLLLLLLLSGSTGLPVSPELRLRGRLHGDTFFKNALEKNTFTQSRLPKFFLQKSLLLAVCCSGD